MTPAIRHETVGSSGSQQHLRIAHLSDFHLWFSDRKLREIEQRVASWQPDVLALTGDYADTPVGRSLALEWIQRMAAAYPLCWVAGNHDRWWGRSFLRKLETLSHAHAIDQRDARILGRNGARYRFTSWERLADSQPAGAASGPTVVLMHDPARIEPEKLQGGRNHLLLAGHLHGGQITLWRDRQGRSQPAASCYKWLVDRATIAAASLIVSRGMGDTLPLRFRAPQEIVMIDFWT